MSSQLSAGGDEDQYDIGAVGRRTTVTITGTNLLHATAVDFGASPGKVISDTATRIVVKDRSSTTAGAVGVTITAAGGTSAPLQFTYVASPSVTSVNVTSGVSPASGPLEAAPW